MSKRRNSSGSPDMPPRDIAERERKYLRALEKRKYIFDALRRTCPPQSTLWRWPEAFPAHVDDLRNLQAAESAVLKAFSFRRMKCFGCGLPLLDGYGRLVEGVVAHPYWPDDYICKDCNKKPRCVCCERPSNWETHPELVISREENKEIYGVCHMCHCSGRCVKMSDFGNVIAETLIFFFNHPLFKYDLTQAFNIILTPPEGPRRWGFFNRTKALVDLEIRVVPLHEVHKRTLDHVVFPVIHEKYTPDHNKGPDYCFVHQTRNCALYRRRGCSNRPLISEKDFPAIAYTLYRSHCEMNAATADNPWGVLPRVVKSGEEETPRSEGEAGIEKEGDWLVGLPPKKVEKLKSLKKQIRLYRTLLQENARLARRKEYKEQLLEPPLDSACFCATNRFAARFLELSDESSRKRDLPLPELKDERLERSVPDDVQAGLEVAKYPYCAVVALNRVLPRPLGKVRKYREEPMTDPLLDDPAERRTDFIPHPDHTNQNEDEDDDEADYQSANASSEDGSPTWGEVVWGTNMIFAKCERLWDRRKPTMRITIAQGLPQELTEVILMHELGHAFYHATGIIPQSLALEEGICDAQAVIMLRAQMLKYSGGPAVDTLRREFAEFRERRILEANFPSTGHTHSVLRYLSRWGWRYLTSHFGDLARQAMLRRGPPTPAERERFLAGENEELPYENYVDLQPNELVALPDAEIGLLPEDEVDAIIIPNDDEEEDGKDNVDDKDEDEGIIVLPAEMGPQIPDSLFEANFGNIPHPRRVPLNSGERPSDDIGPNARPRHRTPPIQKRGPPHTPSRRSAVSAAPPVAAQLSVEPGRIEVIGVSSMPANPEDIPVDQSDSDPPLELDWGKIHSSGFGNSAEMLDNLSDMAHLKMKASMQNIANNLKRAAEATMQVQSGAINPKTLNRAQRRTLANQAKQLAKPKHAKKK